MLPTRVTGQKHQTKNDFGETLRQSIRIALSTVKNTVITWSLSVEYAVESKSAWNGLKYTPTDFWKWHFNEQQFPLRMNCPSRVPVSNDELSKDYHFYLWTKYACLNRLRSFHQIYLRLRITATVKKIVQKPSYCSLKEQNNQQRSSKRKTSMHLFQQFFFLLTFKSHLYNTTELIKNLFFTSF